MLRALPLALLGLAGLTGPAAPPAPPPPVAAPDTTGARLLLTREGAMVQVVPLYVAPAGVPDTLRYELEVLREGRDGRSSSRQGGAFAPEPGRTDTLSVASVNVVPGDRLRVHLRLLADGRLVDEAHHDEVVSASY
jgi:hypothetical protein